MTQEAHFVGEVRDGVAWARLNRPEALNAFSDEMRDLLIAFLLKVESDPNVRCIVLEGGGRHFMAGGDVKSFTEHFQSSPEKRKLHFEATCHKMHPLIFLLRRIPKPVLASVQGACAGLGVSLVLASDLALASDVAFFTLAYSKLGTTPDGGATWFLPRAVGSKRAAELAMLGDRIDAETAEHYGLVNRVIPADRLREETVAWANRLAQGATLAIGRTKALLNAAGSRDLEAQLQAEGVSFSLCSSGEEMAEGVRAFIEKRSPVFMSK
ncbi:MAG: enoyl-CoA hydratase-related protein [Xanthobacteraceae bacterium]